MMSMMASLYAFRSGNGFKNIHPQRYRVGLWNLKWWSQIWNSGGSNRWSLGLLEALSSTGFGVICITRVKHHRHGLHPGHSIQAALPSRVKPGSLELQLIIARNFNERTPAECSLEACSKSEERQATRRKSHIFKWKFPSTSTESSV